MQYRPDWLIHKEKQPLRRICTEEEEEEEEEEREILTIKYNARVQQWLIVNLNHLMPNSQ